MFGLYVNIGKYKMKLLKFGAVWCSSCQGLAMTLGGIDHPLVESMENIDVDDSPDKMKTYDIRGVPTLIIVDDDGNELRRKSGMLPVNALKEFLG